MPVDGGCQRGVVAEGGDPTAACIPRRRGPLYWIEDPCLRDDFDGLRSISQAVPRRARQRRRVPRPVGQAAAARAAGGGRAQHPRLDQRRHEDRAGWPRSTASRSSVGNTNFEIGVHVAAALPEVTWLEYSFLSYNHLLETPIEFRDGYALVPDRPGHGLRLAEAARSELARPS